MTNQDDKIYGEILSIYSRREALADGAQKDISTIAGVAGIRFPVFITQAAYFEAVAVPPGVECQDEEGRLWDVLWMLVCAIRRTPGDADNLVFALHVRNSNEGGPVPVTLSAFCGPVDFDDPRPAITIMKPGED